MTITEKQLNYLMRKGYDRTYVAGLTKHQASKIISGIIGGNKSYMLTPYNSERVISLVKSALDEMERSR